MLRALTKFALEGALPDMTTTPSVPKVPNIPKPSAPSVKGGPATMSMGLLAPPGGPTGGLSIKAPTQMGGSTDAGKTTTAAFMDGGTLPLAAGAGGGIGGYVLGSKVINPLIKMKEESIRQQMARGEKVLEGMGKARKAAPLIAGAISALLLATLVAHKVKRNEREKIEREQLWGSRNPAPSPVAGFDPADQVQFGQTAFY